MKKVISGIEIEGMNIFRFTLVAIMFLGFAVSSLGQNKNDIRLKDYRPVSIYKVPVTFVPKPKYPAIDAHVHPCRTDEAIAQCIKVMDACGIEKAYLMTGATGERFDNIAKMYAKYGNRFELWCGFDYTGYDKPGYGPDAVKELERCFKNGAKGVGELMYKGKGISPSAYLKNIMLPDDPRVDVLFEKCAELGMPVNLHMSEDKWMYEKNDSTNDGLMNSASWHIEIENGAKTHEELLDILENTLKKHPKTTFIAAHLANCCTDLSVLGKYFDRYSNLYADISARFGEIAPIPKYVHNFIEKYQNRIIYAADMTNYDERVYRGSFRILESADEHFYEFEWSPYHWALNGLFLSDRTLKKLYRDNVIKIMNDK
jgi:uncharacterized protein